MFTCPECRKQALMMKALNVQTFINDATSSSTYNWLRGVWEDNMAWFGKDPISLPWPMGRLEVLSQ